MQCLILAGGLGTRMRPVTERVPKVLIEALGRPFVHHQLELLARNEIERVVFAIGHKGAVVRDAVGDGRAFGVSATFVDEGETLRGTGGAVRLAVDAGALDEAFFVLYGDSYLPIDYRAVWEASGHGDRPLMTVYRNQGRFDSSNAVVRDGRVALYQKGRTDQQAIGMDHSDSGLSVLRRDLVAELIPDTPPQDLADLFHALSVEGSLKAYQVDERFYEIGSPSGLADFEAYLAAHGGVSP